MLGLGTELYDSETGGMEDGYAVASEMDYKKVESIGEAMEAVVNLCFMIWPVGDAHHAAEGELVLRDGKVGRGGPEEVGRHLRRRDAEAERHQGRGEERTPSLQRRLGRGQEGVPRPRDQSRLSVLWRSVCRR